MIDLAQPILAAEGDTALETPERPMVRWHEFHCLWDKQDYAWRPCEIELQVT